MAQACNMIGDYMCMRQLSSEHLNTVDCNLRDEAHTMNVIHTNRGK